MNVNYGVKCPICTPKYGAGCTGHEVEPSPEDKKQRLERIATAVLAGMRANPDKDDAYEQSAIEAVASARALIHELDKEPQ